MNLRDVLRSRISHEQLGLLLRLADWVISHPGQPLTLTDVRNLSGITYADATLQAMLHDALYTVGGPERLDFTGPIEIKWAGAKKLLKYPGTPQKPRGKKPEKLVPDDLTPEQWQALWNRIWKNRPWIIFPGQSERLRHCSPRWVKQEVANCLDWFRARAVARADWVATCMNWIARGDDQRLERSGSDLLSPASFHRMAKERPDQFWPAVIERKDEE